MRTIDILKATATACDMPLTDLVELGQGKECRPRIAAIWLARARARKSRAQIAAAMKRDPSTIREAIRQADHLIARADPDFLETLNSIQAALDEQVQRAA